MGRPAANSNDAHYFWLVLAGMNAGLHFANGNQQFGLDIDFVGAGSGPSLKPHRGTDPVFPPARFSCAQQGGNVSTIWPHDYTELECGLRKIYDSSANGA